MRHLSSRLLRAVTVTVTLLAFCAAAHPAMAGQDVTKQTTDILNTDTAQKNMDTAQKNAQLAEIEKQRDIVRKDHVCLQAMIKLMTDYPDYKEFIHTEGHKRYLDLPPEKHLTTECPAMALEKEIKADIKAKPKP